MPQGLVEHLLQDDVLEAVVSEDHLEDAEHKHTDKHTWENWKEK